MARIRLPLDVYGDWPFPGAGAAAGEHEARVNPLGAVSVIARDGKPLGIRPHELEWIDEPPALAPEHTDPREKWFRARIGKIERERDRAQEELGRLEREIRGLGLGYPGLRVNR